VRALALLLVLLGAQDVDPRPSFLLMIADDWGWPHAGAYGDKVVKTPAFDRVAREGALFTNAYCASPSCTPSRCGLLTGQYIHRIEEAGNLWSTLPAKFDVYPELLEAKGYAIGSSGKTWGPGSLEAGGRTKNPGGPSSPSFAEFLKKLPAGKPFCFWFGGVFHNGFDPHRPFDKGAGVKSGMKIEDVAVPPYLPDTPEVRSDFLDYYVEVQRFDRDVEGVLRALEAAGRAANTIVVVTSDNGHPFPRAKGNIYDAGSRVPLAVRWPAKVKAGQVIDGFVSLTDLAPTFLEAAGIAVPAAMTGRNLFGPARDRIYLERERHTNSRKGSLSYPMRAVRTKDHLYIRNLRPDRWPQGDPEKHDIPDNPHPQVDVGIFADCDQGPTKDLVIAGRDRHFRLAFEKRPAEEFYDLAKDPHQIENVADRPEHAEAKARLRADLDRWMRETADPRAADDDDRWDRYPYIGGAKKK
jgi:arylsulfatase A-like enzyme